MTFRRISTRRASLVYPAGIRAYRNEGRCVKEWTKRIGLADHYGTTAEVTFYPVDDEGDADLTINIGIGGCIAEAAPTPEAARQLAAALLDAADAVDATTVDAA